MEGNLLYTDMNPMIAYEKGLATWARWVDLNVDPSKTRIFFRSMSPRHNRYAMLVHYFLDSIWISRDLNKFLFPFCRENGWKCYNQREPLAYFSHLHVPEPLVVLKGVLRRMRFPVYLQDITAMSALRRDGHPSVYRREIDQKQKQHLKGLSSDCSHWCLPGVPDTWNEMLSAAL